MPATAINPPSRLVVVFGASGYVGSNLVPLLVTQGTAAAKVERIVYLGGLTPSGADSEHLVSRKESGDVLRSGAVPVTEIRAGIIVGAGSAAYEVMRDLVYNLPVMLTPKWVRSKSSPIALENLLRYLVQVSTMPQTSGHVYDAGGPDYLSYQQMMIVFGEVVGKRPLIIPVPLLSPRLSSYWLGLVTAVPSSIARALIGGLKHDIPANDAALRVAVPQRLLTFREAVVAALDAERRQQVTARWTEGAFPYRAYRHDYAYYARERRAVRSLLRTRRRSGGLSRRSVGPTATAR